eukprot:8544616-Pyramimonas_sp.AAC.1
MNVSRNVDDSGLAKRDPFVKLQRAGSCGSVLLLCGGDSPVGSSIGCLIPAGRAGEAGVTQAASR